MSISPIRNSTVTKVTSVEATILTQSGVVIVGLGVPQRQSDKGACVINHKGAESVCRSTSEFVAQASPERLSQWQKSIGDHGIQKILLEDLSLDTCFALLLFLDRTSTTPSMDSAKVAFWIDYVSAWEQGFYPDKGTPPIDSVACLVSLLGQSYLSTQDYKAGLIEACTFLSEIFLNHTDPRNARPDRASLAYRRALARHDLEYEQLRVSITYGLRFQLLLPSCGGHERVLTDAIELVEKNEPTAILKVLLRNDTTNAWTRRGFGVLALHRPTLMGTGNDMTISVAPDAGLSLDALWENLEHAEDEKWGNERPRGTTFAPDGRTIGTGRQLQSYIEKDVPVDRWPQQPWWDARGGGEPCSTLVGAPKSVQIGETSVLGTKLGWSEDVLPILWKTYSPIPPNLAISTIDLPGKMKLATVQWDSDARRDVLKAPSFLGWLAAQSMANRQIVSPRDLPHPDSFEVITLPGGVAIAHRDGLTLLNHSIAADFAEKPFTDTATQVADCVNSYLQFMESKWLSNAIGKSANKATKKKFAMKDLHIWQAEAADAKLILLQAMKSNHEQLDTYEQGQLRTLLAKRWGLGDHRAQALDLLARLDEVTQEKFSRQRETRDKWLNAIVTGLGTGLLAKAVLEPFRDKFTMNIYEWQVEVFKRGTNIKRLDEIAQDVANWELASVATFLVFFVIGGLLYWFKGAKISGSE